MDNLIESVGSELEQEYVKSTYESIADDFSSTRYRKWPKVDSFLKNLPTNSLVLDVGCGNGKYLDNGSTFNLGCDASSNLLGICKSKGFEVVTCDMMQLPFKDSTFDAIICIAALHHLSTRHRRKMCLENMIKLLADDNSRILVQVWSYEQELERNNTYLNEKKMSKRGESFQTGDVKLIGNIKIPIHENRTPFCNQDLLVPFKVSKCKSSSSHSRETNQKGESEESQYLRYYHVFKKNELESLMVDIPNAKLVSSYYDKGNWCSIIKKSY